MQAQQLRDAGKEPYAYNFVRTHMAADLHKQFASLENGHEAELGVCPWAALHIPQPLVECSTAGA